MNTLVFLNKNTEYISKYGIKLFDGILKFGSALNNFSNEGSLVASSIVFNAGNAKVNNAAEATIQTEGKIKGKVGTFSNSGTIASMESSKPSIKLDFKTFINRGKVVGRQGVSFHGDILRNYTDLSLTDSHIRRLFNGESITDDFDDAFLYRQKSKLRKHRKQ